VTRLAFALALLAAMGCTPKLHVQSDTRWAGAINGEYVTGEGNMTYEMKRRPEYSSGNCAAFNKLTEEGYLTLHVEQRWQDDDTRTTTEPYGRVGVCAK